MFYSFIKHFVSSLIFLINGKPDVHNSERLPEGSYVLVAPHRTWFDPVLHALAAYPQRFSFMAKKELFQNRFLSWLITKLNAFPVDRQNPGPSAIKTPVKILKKGELSTIIFPSGTRHSQELKNGAFVIAKLANVPIVPAIYQGPLTFKGLFTRQKIHINFGEPITIDRKTKMNDENLAMLEEELNNAFVKLDNEVDPTFKYIDISNKETKKASK
ncbi:1-acyl-sn-glycerol-3-phosphate acyltransferase [Pediococcus pentosaceus]|uniref:lysophospholipid acyltransferase family protein n=1 Tax=Pediococcus pentosaceus TaxID=1255 RepID=UPI0013305B4E|nr:1-acyl-sn-glycerol-3-phosphate acyltransferase [Pediococcus pentosaceus]KAF0506249.1 1-acyl-sn-glycerol-3-phosphate acyltransferase [Pediococcus pentosaceus]MBF7139947.1 1-acyl-sn-glycerol-3-phosphate acyltransferase [Pediococcus pentosaceus]MCM6819609.1 1-acyl-sn-glycerol-3-phosphate acyltransferase [Pediococcus pentosaceus]